jgi:hypothetical protein
MNDRLARVLTDLTGEGDQLEALPTPVAGGLTVTAQEHGSRREAGLRQGPPCSCWRP